MPDTPRTIAIFDFDHTLVQGDSFWPFLGYAVGWPHTFHALFKSLLAYSRIYLRDKHNPAIADHRTFLKTELLKNALTGTKLADIAPALDKLRQWKRWHDGTRKALLDHKAKGHHIVIASGGLGVYLHELFKDMPYDAILCTELEVKDGVITGLINGGNCVRQHKADLVAAYLIKNGPFVESWGYGNLPHDLPMLQLVKHRIII